MNTPIPIHKLAAQVELTSRTLRHWESKGLYNSMRDKDSGWRAYDETAILCIRITALLRQLDIPIRDIKTVLDNKTYDSLCVVIEGQITLLKVHNKESARKEKHLVQFLSILKKQKKQMLTDIALSQILVDIRSADDSEHKMKELIITNNKILQFITLPPMRTVYNIAVGVSPEDEAISPVLDWLESVNLMGTAKLYGGNMPPMPSGTGKPYGFGMCASIPEDVDIPGHLKEMRLPGGTYARLESTDDISADWKKLMKWLSADERYTSDRSRMCLEEHIRDDKDGFFVILLEPVKAKQ